MMPVMLEAALRSLLLAMVVWGGLRALRVRNVVAQKAAWGLVLGAALLMPLLAPLAARFLPASAAVTLPFHSVAQPAQVQPVQVQQLQVKPAPEIASAHHATKPEPIASVTAQRRSVSSAPLSTHTPGPEIAPSLNVISPLVAKDDTSAPVSATPLQPAQEPVVVSLASISGVLYLGVAGALLIRLFYGLASALYLLFAAEPIPSHRRAHFGDGIRLCVSRAVSSPVTIGSAVVLPADYAEWDAEKMRIVLAHERSHIRQGDFYLQFLAGLYAALIWFSPLGWWLKRELSDLAETISDRAGLEQAASTTAYAQILLEFAAAPRPAVLGVAMARTGSLSRRIERLLNDNAFRQAFAGGRRRAIIAVLLVPVALVGATAVVRVQAAQETALPSTQPAPAAQPAPAPQAAEPATGVSNPEPVTAAAPGTPDAHDSGVEIRTGGPVAPGVPGAVVAPAAPAVLGQTVILPGGSTTLTAPAAPFGPAAPRPRVVLGRGEVSVFALAQDDTPRRGRHGSYRYRYMIDGDSYALISGDNRTSMNFSGDIHTGDIDKARKLAHGDFLWFARDDKQYYIDDPAIVEQIEAMYKPMEELGKKQEELGRQQEELGKQQEALGRQQEQATVPAPDMQKEMAEIDAAMARLKTKMGQNITSDELGDLQDKLGDLQGRLGALQGKIGEKQGEFGAQQGKLGEEQGRLGAEQGRLGAEQGRLARDADRKVHSIIDESLQNGKARPVN
jgi:beta-lactamase regulating signal transducer with metallopeptidase domain